MPTTAHPNKWDTFRQFASYGLRYKVRLLYVVLCSAAISLSTLLMFSLLKPVMEIIFYGKRPEPSGRLGWVVDWVLTVQDWLFGLIMQFSHENPMMTLAFVCLLILIVMFINGILNYIQTYMVQWVGNRVILDMQRELFEKMMHYNIAYYNRSKVGYLLSYFTVDARVVGMTVFYVFGRLVLDPLQVLGALISLVWMQWKLTLLYAFIFPLIVVTIRFFANKNRRAGRRLQDITASMGAFLQEHFSAIRLVQGYGMYGRQRKLLEKETRGVFDASMSMARAMAASSPINEFLGIFAVCCVLILAGTIILRPGASDLAFNGGDFMVYIGLLVLLYQPIKRIERSIQQIQQGLAAGERLFSALNLDAVLPRSSHPRPFSSFEKEIGFDGVTFAYEEGTDVLSDVSFTARKGEQIAIVGPSGAGKTTLVNLLPRFYDPIRGAIHIDGYDLREFRLEDLRSRISMVYQDVVILGDTVRLNLTCGDERYTQEQIETATRAAFAHEFIETLPQGYDTVVGERGESLSGGQCQRIAIARAFLRDAPILILDEATSSLDSESEEHIKQSMRHLMQGRTAFVIAHRLSTILQADRILVLEHGRIVDSGPHGELLQRCELYQRLYKLQFSDEEIFPTSS